MRNTLLRRAKNKKALGILTVLCFIVIATLYVARTAMEENKQHLFEYKVRADDTCTKIAVAFNVPVISIIQANDLERDCSDIYAGQVLLIPYPTQTPTGSPVATSRGVIVDCEREIYTVKTGDTLETISNKYQIPKDAIVFFNGLTKDNVETGMQLVIPLCYTTPAP